MQSQLLDMALELLHPRLFQERLSKLLSTGTQMNGETTTWQFVKEISKHLLLQEKKGEKIMIKKKIRNETLKIQIL